MDFCRNSRATPFAARWTSLAAVVATLVVAPPAVTAGAQGAALPADSVLVRALTFRSIGPAVMSGRIVDLAVTRDPHSPLSRVGSVIYAGAATGAIWKSTNSGQTWTPVFDSVRTGSIGAVAVAPSDPDIVWVGTGEANNMRSSSWGTGVYRTLDGGKTWSGAMLPKSQHIGHIVIDPRDPNTVYVAAVGPLWAPGGQRGLFKTTDGGKTWVNTKEISKYTGFGDVQMDPSNPDILYAAAEQRERREYGFLPGGPESAIYKTTDGAKTWTKLAGGLPTTDIGRIGMSICKSRPSVVYAMVHAKAPGNGLYRSDDAGTTWHHVNDVNGTAWYYSQVYCDPTDVDHVITLSANSRESHDGGKTFVPFAAGNGIHTDHHALWIASDDPNQIMLGSDGGLYSTWDGGKTWDHNESIVAAQFYTIAVDDALPFYNVYGGLQDNNTWGGPSRTRNAYGPTNGDWFRMAGGDGFFAVPDPNEHQIVYAESQQGGVVRYDERIGQTKSIRPMPTGLEHFRYNWSTPILPSKHTPGTVYIAANFLFKSTDRGDTWTKISPDLTRDIDRNKLPMRGAIPDSSALGRNEGTAEFSNISTMDESPVRAGLLAVGTDDGLIQVTRDGGKTWTKTDAFPNTPETTYVSRVVWSKANEGTIYASFDGHRSNDFKAYLAKSTDYGKTWTSITGDMPDGGAVQVIREHPRQPNLLFAGTEFGVFETTDGGSHWTQLKSGIPGVPVFDLVIQPRANDLVVGTHGRGIYILDDVMPLEQLAQAKAAAATKLAYLYPIEDALLFQPNNSRNSGMGTRGFTGKNPDPGAQITYLLDAPSDAKVSLSILDASRAVVRELPAPHQEGMHRLNWDMRVGPPLTGPVDTAALARLANGNAAAGGRGGRGGGAGGGRGGAAGGAAAPADSAGRAGGPGGAGGFGGGRGGAVDPMFSATPGKYFARLTITPKSGTATVLEQPFALTKDPMVQMSDAELKQLYAFRLQVTSLQRTLRDQQAQLDTAQRTVAAAKRAADSSGSKVTPELKAQVASIEKELADITKEMGAANAGRGGRGGGGGGAAPARGPTDTIAVANNATGAAPQGRGGRGGRGGAGRGGAGAAGAARGSTVDVTPAGAARAGAAANATAGEANAENGNAGGDDAPPPQAPQNTQARLGTTTEMLNTTFNPNAAQRKTVQTLPAELKTESDRLKKVSGQDLPALLKALHDAGVDVKKP